MCAEPALHIRLFGFFDDHIQYKVASSWLASPLCWQVNGIPAEKRSRMVVKDGPKSVQCIVARFHDWLKKAAVQEPASRLLQDAYTAWACYSRKVWKGQLILQQGSSRYPVPERHCCTRCTMMSRKPRVLLPGRGYALRSTLGCCRRRIRPCCPLRLSRKMRTSSRRWSLRSRLVWRGTHLERGGCRESESSSAGDYGRDASYMYQPFI
jgi:hypothetical protein